MDDGETDAASWLDRGIARTAKAFLAATASADRLSLLREWTRLSHGTLSTTSAGINLSGRERDLLNRFGLHLTGDLLTLDSAPRSLPSTFSEAMRLDSRDRRPYVASPPDAALLMMSEHRTYRCETQKAAFRALLTMPPASSLMVSMPTGTGKSLLFQAAPAAWPTAGTACIVVITPTIALALDHERTLRSMRGLEGSRALTGQLSSSERSDILDAFRRGEIPILLMSPELAMGAALEALHDAALPPDQKASGVDAHLTGLVVDEAHIIESWGRSFRPDFQRLPGFVDALRHNNPELRVALLSATLTPAARSVLKQGYGGGQWREVHAGVPRYEFDVATHWVGTPEDRDDLVLQLVDHAPRPAIVYVNKVEHAQSLADRLVQSGYARLAVFTGAVSDAGARRSIIDEWAADGLDLVIATSAFGMGIDKADVRTVIHAGIPEDAARYYQEIGRAGRDGHQGIGLAVWTRTLPGTVVAERDDETQAAGMAAGSWLTMEKAKPRWNRMRTLVERRGGVAWHGGQRLALFDIDAMHDELSGESSDYNRRWNMSLLNLLQRAGKLRIVSVERDERDALQWKAEVLDDALFDGDGEQDDLWDELLALRSDEQGQATRDFRSFRDVLAGEGGCLLAGVYRLVDPVAFAPRCGRCPPCRRDGTSPPDMVHCGTGGGLWSQIAQPDCGLPSGTTLIEADAAATISGSGLISLAGLGVTHFVVPESSGSNTAQVLSGCGSRTFVSEHREWSGPHALPPLEVPTAVLLADDDEAAHRIWRRTATFAAGNPDLPVVIVAPRGLMFEGRPLEQIASTSAPYTFDALRSISERWYAVPSGANA